VQWIDVGKNHGLALMGPLHLGWFVEVVCLVLLDLGLDIQDKCWHVVVVDQAFPSPLLLLILLSAGIYAVGTAQRKFRGYPGNRFDEKGVLVEPPGQGKPSRSLALARDGR
jgi:hypothetical protein